MLGLILLLAIAYACACAIDNATSEVSKKHKKRIAKASKKKGRRLGAKAAAWAATALTAAGTFAKAFAQGFKREWPKAKKRAAEKIRRAEPAAVEEPKPAPAPAAPDVETAAGEESAAPAIPAQADPEARKLVLIKNDTHTHNTGVLMAIATIPEITGVNTLKSAVARTASEATTTAEEASAMAQRAQDEMAAIEAMIEQAAGLEFGDDGGTLQELAALRDMCAAALEAAQKLQQAMVDKAAIAAQSSRNIHTRHGGIQEAVATTGGRMASKQAYTADV
ncbi:hypothetical protein ACH4F6_31550 [Streptomyces sp. NPDC017936]|uniref:hypothetical protein n=1 Tax=Streptomyces sp. NPDC017936 TaxID=3365016 RepID=UPI003796CA42